MFATSYDEAKASIDAGYVYHLLESVEKVGPHGYIHGWIKVGAGDDKALDGKKVDAMTPQGGTASGTYDHKSGTVTDDSGRKSSVSHVRPEGSGNSTDLEGHLRDQHGWSDDEFMTSGSDAAFEEDHNHEHGPLATRKPSHTHSSSGGGIGGALGQQFTQRLKMYEEAKVLIDARYAASLVSGSYQGSWLD